ncbi:MAG: signal recognition particle-docking protein FtsY [Oscillatoriales cyanobacterium RM2_1_1]|nr:signal recognition particle-docking protein FtsY [Oscillatoriales cyanobacterium RM2_1_1]
MVFNWFRRQYDPEKDAEAASEELPAQTPRENQKSPQSFPTKPPSSPPETPVASPEDYLQWAKAAYQTIQQQQTADAISVTEQSPVEPPPVEPFKGEQTRIEQSALDPSTLEPSDSEPSAKPPEPLTAADLENAIADTAQPLLEPSDSSKSSQPQLDVPAIPLATEVELPSTSEASREPALLEVSMLEPSPELSPDQLTASPEVDPPSPTPLPLWARAEAERQARIERLKQTALEEPQPELSPTPVSSTPEIPLTFDEQFLWSAEVLANQGRRPDQVSLEEITWLQKLWQGLGRTRRSLLNQLKSIVGQGPLNQTAVEEIEALLLQADVGVEATDTIVEALQARLRQEALPPEQAIAYLKQILRDILEQPYHKGYSPTFAPEKDTLNIWLITGVNGAGKTTTIGKIAHLARQSDYQCLIGAADTFRAAAVEQVKVWGQRSGVDVIANPGQNTDPAAVVFDAIAAARARKIDLLLVDTAGRLQNKKNLMTELSKVRRVIDKQAADAKVESLLVLDSTLGQNGLRQAEVFAEAAQLSGVILTKLDGTAKGGVALAVVQRLGLPIRFIGVGESIEDLRPFSSYEFIEALLSD